MITDDIIPQAQATVSGQLVEELVPLTELSQSDLLSLLGFTDQAFDSVSGGALSILMSEHLLLLRRLFQHGLAVFDHDKAALTKWLRTPSPDLAQPPTGFFPVGPVPSPPPLEEMTSFEPYDLTAYAAKRDQQPAQDPGQLAEKRPYPSPFSLLNTSTGLGLVDAALSRIGAGIYR